MTSFEALCEQIKSKLAHRNSLDYETMVAQQAAVALVLRRNVDVPELLVIKRAIRPGDHWSGHLALPGGRWQLPDRDLLDTAIRETYEEVGVDLSVNSEVLGQLNTLNPRSPRLPQIDVTPFIFTAPPAFHITWANEEPQSLALNHEVAAAFWVPVDYLKSQGLSDAFQYTHEGEERSWPAYPSEHGPIWGLTERMLTNFLEVIA